jgi:signal transduction histidine kinase
MRAPRQLTPVQQRFAVFGPAFIALALALAVLAGFARAREGGARVEHTHEVLGELDHTLLRLVDAETGARGFRLTFDATYLSPYLDAGRDVKAGLARLREMTADRASQQRRLDAIGSLVIARLALLDSAVRTSQLDARAAAASGVPISSRGRLMMDSVRTLIGSMRNEEARLLTERTAAEDSRTVLVIGLAVVGSLLAAALALLTNWLLNGVATRETALARELEARTAERERLIADLEAANNTKMNFLTTMSHELRTPLNAMDGYAELLAMGIRGPVNAEQSKDLERIRHGGRYVLSLINDILSFAKLQSGHIELNLSAVRLREALAGAETLVAPQASAKGITFVHPPVDPSVVVLADPERLQQVVLNLVTNAVKFTDAGGTITLMSEANGRFARVTVSDTGRGIPPDKLQTIFDPFVQVGQTRIGTPLRDGLGLGLAISRDLVTRMGGELTVESKVGQGSTFAFNLKRGNGAEA